MTNLHTIKQMVEDGFAARKIARDLNLEFEEVRKIIKTNNFNLVKENFDDSDIGNIISLYEKGVSAKQLGIKYSIDKRRIQKWVDNAGILRTQEESHRLKFINEHAFDIIADQDQAYWLGFLYADAYNNERKGSVNLCLKGSDIGHVKKYVNFFNGEEKDIATGTIISEDNKEYHTCSYKINSKYLSKKLKQLGCPQAKSFIIKFPTWLDEGLKPHFVRGYFDGDGSIKVSKRYKEWRVNICSTKEMCQSIQEICNLLKITSSISYISETENNTWILVISGNQQVKTFCDWMYQDAKTFLDRKHDRYLNLCIQQNNRKFNKNLDRDNYFISEEVKTKIAEEILAGAEIEGLAEKYQVSSKSVSVIKDSCSILSDDIDDEDEIE